MLILDLTAAHSKGDEFFMVEKIIINPTKVRGYGNILNVHTSTDYELSDCTITETTDTVNGATETVYQLEDTILFFDPCRTDANKSSGYYVGRGTYNLTDTGLEIITSVVSGSNQYNFRIYNGAITVPFEISFELVSNNTDNARMYFYNGNYGTELGNLSIYDLENPTLVKFTVTSEKITRTIGTTSTDMTLSTTIGSTVSTRFGYNQSASAETTKIRNYRVRAL
jgi:hypothetical protein